MKVIHLFLILCSVTNESVANAFPLGVNLSPLSGENIGGDTFASVNWNPTSTNVFIDIFKHCSPLYIRKTTNGGISFLWESNSAVAWRRDMYPTSLPKQSPSSFSVGMCDIGAGGSFFRSGSYVVLWDGTGDVSLGSSHVQSQVKLSNNSKSVILMVNPLYTAGLSVRIMASVAGDPVHNVRIVPTDFAHNYTSQIFQPSFLKIIEPFEHIRFTGWQKISSLSKNWTTRTTPSHQTQHLADGVAVEHMVQLVHITGVRSVSFSFPLQSAAYNKKFIEYIAVSMPPDMTIYYEAGCPESFSDSDRSAESLALFDQFDQVFNNIQNYREEYDFKLFPTGSVSQWEYVPYLISRFGSNLNRVKAVAVPAEFGKSPNSWDYYGSRGIWDIYFSNHTIDALVAEVQHSVLTAEVMLNDQRQKLIGANPNLNFISYTAGPLIMANNYGYRAGKNSVENCVSKNAFPCTWANTKYNFKNISEYNAARAMIVHNATLEQILENKLIIVQRDDRIYDMYLDFIRRWEAIGGGLLVTANLVQPATTCPTGGKGCGNPGIFENPFFRNCGKCAKYSAPVDYKAGKRSTLPYTSADISVAATAYTCSTDSCQWGYCSGDECKCFAGFEGERCNISSPFKRTDCIEDVGINLAGIADWSTEWTYVDVFKSSREWITQDFWPGTVWNTESTMYLVDDYPARLSPNQKVGSMMIRDLGEHIPAGVYVVLYDGDGILTFSMDVVKVNRSVGRIEVTIKPSSGLNNGLFLTIARTNPADPIRNIRVYMPGYEHSALPFHPLFLDSVKNYRVFRFMDWANTNSAKYSEWKARSTRNGTRSYSGAAVMPGTDLPSAGVPIEDMILLSNLMGAGAWFNMPHLCDDDFVRRHAELVRDTLRPDVKIYVEYSNEVWGTLFNGGKYAQQEGLRLGLATGDAEARFCFYVKRSSEIFGIWKTVFGSADRLEFVYSSQAVQPYVSTLMLRCSSRLAVQTNATVLATAPYFGTYTPSVHTDFDLFMNTTLPNQIASISSTMAAHLAIAINYGLQLVTYEAGQGLQGSGSSTDFALRANRDRRMIDLYHSYCEMLRASGIDLVMQFSSTSKFSTSSTWGLLEASDQDPNNSPKYKGLMQYVSQHTQCTGDKDIFSKGNTSTLKCSGNGVFVQEINACECYYGAKGDNCEHTYYTEHTDWCGYYCYFYQGTCVPSIIEGTERYWECECKAGYYGHQCQLFDCKDNCNFNGQCLDIDICSCYPGYSGEFCEQDCGCAGHGICNLDNSTSTRCLCDIGWEWSGGGAGACVLAAPPAYYELPNSTFHSCTEACVHGVCIDELCTCFSGVIGERCDEYAPDSRGNSNSLIGTNLAGIAYWSTAWSFVDVMKGSGDWVSLDYPGLKRDSKWGVGPAISLREDGYPSYLLPGQVAAKLMLRDVHKHAPEGRYICLFDGDGELDFKFDAAVVSVGKQRVEFTFAPSWREGCTSSYCGDNGILMIILKTNPENPIRNIRIIMPGFEATHEQVPFHPWFLRDLEGYSVLRFMDWMQTNNNKEKVWTDRPQVTKDSQSKGVALEHMIQLSNTLGAAPWFCIPHMADDNYVRQFATLVKNTLRQDLEIYIEYSNEVWNGLFAQSKYAEQEGLRLNFSTVGSLAKYRFYAYRSVEIFKIWEDVFSPTGVKINKVLSTWTISPSATQEILSFQNASQHATFVGVGPYFDCDGIASPSKAGFTALMSPDSVLDECLSSWDYIMNPLESVKNVATSFGLHLITYEAGQSLVETAVMEWNNGETAGLTELLKTINRHPRMQDAYETYIDILIEKDVVSKERPLMHFVSTAYPSKYGSWGAIEYTGQPLAETPKYRALRKYFNTPNSTTLCEKSSNNFLLQNNAYSRVDSNSMVGYPAVSSPRYGDVWLSGSEYNITWLVYSGDTHTVSIALHQIESDCTPLHLKSILSVSEPGVASDLGFFSFRVPDTVIFDGTLSYVIEIKGATSSNFSEPFSIVSSHLFNSTSTTCCVGTIVPVFDKCMTSTRAEYSNRKYLPSAWADPTSNAGIAKCSLNKFPKWPSSGCNVLDTGCREYRTSRDENSPYGRFKPVIDCVAQKSAFPKRSDKDLPWDDKYAVQVATNLSQCNSLLGNYPLLPNSCPAIEGINDPRCDIPDPSPSPTARPSLSPTPWPTVQGATKMPTKSPTNSPSHSPTLMPSKPPTRAPVVTRPRSPTPMPTLAPTASTKIAVNYKQDLTGVSAASLRNDSEAQLAFKETVAESIESVTADQVVINNITEGDSSQRRLTLRVEVTETSSASVDFSVVLLIQDLNVQDVDSAVSVINSRISSSITGGSFQSSLKSKSTSSVFTNATAGAINYIGTKVAYLSPAPTPAPSGQPTITMQPSYSIKDHKKKSNEIGIMRVVIGAVLTGIAVTIIVSFLYWCFSRRNDPTLEEKHSCPPSSPRSLSSGGMSPREPSAKVIPFNPATQQVTI